MLVVITNLREHLTIQKSYIVAKEGSKIKTIRFGQKGAKTAGKPKAGESARMKAKRKSFKARLQRTQKEKCLQLIGLIRLNGNTRRLARKRIKLVCKETTKYRSYYVSNSS